MTLVSLGSHLQVSSESQGVLIQSDLESDISGGPLFSIQPRRDSVFNLEVKLFKRPEMSLIASGSIEYMVNMSREITLLQVFFQLCFLPSLSTQITDSTARMGR